MSVSCWDFVRSGLINTVSWLLSVVGRREVRIFLLVVEQANLTRSSLGIPAALGRPSLSAATISVVLISIEPDRFAILATFSISWGPSGMPVKIKFSFRLSISWNSSVACLSCGAERLIVLMSEGGTLAFALTTSAQVL